MDWLGLRTEPFQPSKALGGTSPDSIQSDGDVPLPSLPSTPQPVPVAFADHDRLHSSSRDDE